MDLRRISYFVEVADCRSFTRAGGKLAVAQSALSRQIRDLETELGVVLFHRTGRGVQATEAGCVFLERARKLLSDAESLFADTRSASDGGGSVSIGVPPSISQILLAPFLRRAREARPGLHIRVVEGFSGHISEWLLSGRIDLAVLYKTPSTSTVVADRLLVEDMYLIGPGSGSVLQDKTVSFRQLTDLPLVLPGPPHGLRMLIEKAATKAGIDLRVDIEVDAFSTMKALAESGTAYTILPVSAVAEELDQHRVTVSKLVGPTVQRELLLASATQRPDTRATQDIARILRRQVAELVSTGKWIGRISKPNHERTRRAEDGRTKPS